MTLATEVPLDFDFKYTPAELSTRDYPGSGPEVEIIKLRLNGVEVPLSVITPELETQMIEHVLENYY